MSGRTHNIAAVIVCIVFSQHSTKSPTQKHVTCQPTSNHQTNRVPIYDDFTRTPPIRPSSPDLAPTHLTAPPRYPISRPSPWVRSGARHANKLLTVWRRLVRNVLMYCTTNTFHEVTDPCSPTCLSYTYEPFVRTYCPYADTVRAGCRANAGHSERSILASLQSAIFAVRFLPCSLVCLHPLSLCAC